MNYKLLALDIDGTLLNSKGELSPRTRRAILKGQEQGVVVVLVTGRRLTTTLPWANALGVREPLIVHNGAIIYNQRTQTILSQQGIDLQIANEILDKLNALSLNYIVYTGESAGERVVAPRGSWQGSKDLLGHYLGERAEFLEHVALGVAPIRISIIDHYAKVDSYFHELVSTYGERINTMLFGAERDTWRGIEIIAGHCHKGTGLAYLANHLNLSAAEIIAIGDNVNDVEMICWAGLGIAMENGSKVLKEKAKRIAPSHDHDGVAQIIEELLL